VAACAYPELAVDFRNQWVKSINVRGHKYGLCYPGIGWAIWRTPEDLPEELLFHVNYLGSDQPTYTLNFSKGSGGVIAQYYQLIRLGYRGYRKIMENCIATTKHLTDRIQELGAFEIVSSAADVPATPLVAFRVKDRSRFDEFDFAKHLRRHGWIVPAYSMPYTGEGPPGNALRVVVREDFSRGLADWLVKDMESVLEELNKLPNKIALQAAVEIEKMQLGDTATLQVAENEILEAVKKAGQAREEEEKGEDANGRPKKGHFISKQNPVC
jgi:glutamate decarboxylase